MPSAKVGRSSSLRVDDLVLNIATNLASVALERLTNRHLGETKLGGILKQLGLLEQNFQDVLPKILEQVTKLFFDEHKEYVVDGIDQFILGSSLKFCFLKFIESGKTPNDPALRDEFRHILLTDYECMQLVHAHSWKPELVFTHFLGAFVRVLSHDQTPGELVIRTELEAVRQQIGSLQDVLGSALQQLENELLQQDPFRPYVQELYERLSKILQINVLREIDLEMEPTPYAVLIQYVKQPNMLELAYVGESLVNSGDIPQPPKPFLDTVKTYDWRVLLLGEPGSGKSTTLIRLARDSAKLRLMNPTAPLPLYGIISTWKSEKDYTEPLWRWLARQHESLQAADARNELEHGRPLLLFDGLDELGTERPLDMSKPNGDKYNPRLLFVKQIPDDHRVIMTCRRHDFEQIRQKINLNGAVTLQPLKDTQIENFLGDQDALLEAVSKDLQLREMLRTPLLLRFFYEGYRDSTQDERDQLKDLTKSPLDLRDKIIEQYIQKRYRHESRRYELSDLHQEIPFDLEEVYFVLGWAAVLQIHHFWGDERNFMPDQDDLGKSFQPPIDIKPFIEFAKKLNFVITLAQGRLAFVHLMLRDHFAFHAAMIAIQDLRGDIRDIAVRVLGELGDVRAIPILVNAFQDSEEAVCQSAVFALIKIGTPSVPTLIGELKNVDERLRRAAARALCSIPDERTVDPLIASLSDSDMGVRLYAVQGLGNRRYKRAVMPLIACLSDPDKEVRYQTIQALGVLSDPLAVEPLIIALQDSDKEMRYRAVSALTEIGDDRAIGPLIESLNDTHPMVRSFALEAVGRFLDERAVEPLEKLLSDIEAWHVAPPERICDVAARTLERIGTPNALKIVKEWRLNETKRLMNLLRDPTMQVCPPYGVSCFSWICYDVAVEPLISALDDSHPEVRYRASEALGHIHDARAVEPLIPMLLDIEISLNGRRVCDVVAESLEQIRTPEALEAVRVWREQQARGNDEQ